MLIEVKVPALAESVPDATLLDWYKQPGEAVSRGENLIDLDTDELYYQARTPVGDDEWKRTPIMILHRTHTVRHRVRGFTVRRETITVGDRNYRYVGEWQADPGVVDGTQWRVLIR